MKSHKFFISTKRYKTEEYKLKLNNDGFTREVSSFIKKTLFFGKVYFTHREEILLLHISCITHRDRTTQELSLKQRRSYRIFWSKRRTQMLDKRY